jgi:hypothetical protein
MTQNLETVLERVGHLDWDNQNAGIQSVHKLAEEYMRRQYFWAQTFNTRWHWLSGLPFCVDENVKLTDDIHRVLSSVRFPNVFMRLTCQLMLLWEIVAPAVQHIELPHPYAPLLVLYERSGVLLPEGKIINSPFLTVGAADGTKPLIFQPHLYDIKTALVSLDEDELNHLDRS